MSESIEQPPFESDFSSPPEEALDTANLTGRQIGRYLIGRRLGSGGAAAVYQAYDQVQGRSVALKVLLPGADETTRSRFRQEARTAGALRHPNIVTTLQVGDAPTDGVAYIAMELIEGESLARLLERRGKLLPEESCNLLTPIALALAHAHQFGIVHRDVKPSNILLRPASPGATGSVQLDALDHPVVPLLSDFGIARALDTPELTNVGRTIGTPAYMAPEQCAGSRDVTAQSDIYSTGAVLFRCLVGRAPFLGSVTQILHAHVYEAVTIPDDVLASLPPRVVDVLRATLAKDPAERYADGQALADALILAAGRALPQPGADGAEATSTLTLSSLPTTAVPMPVQRTETVIVAPSSPRKTSPEPVAGVRTAEVAVPARPATATFPTSTPVARQRIWPRFAVGLVGVLALIFVGTILISAGTSSPFRRLLGGETTPPVTRQPIVLAATATGSSIALLPTQTANPPASPPETIETAPAETVPAEAAPPETATAEITPLPTHTL
ncbi:MAG: protein kinase, partial [Caldilineaceae bacterium]